MAHFSPKVAQSKGRMAHPVRRDPLRSAGGALAGLVPDSSGTGVGGASARLLERLTPRSKRGRGLAIVGALLIVAVAVSAGLPGGWAAAPSASPSADLAANLGSVDPADSITPSPDETTSEDPSLTSESASPSQASSPTPKPTPPPAKTPRIYKFVALGDSLTAWPSDNPWPSRLDAEDANLKLAHNAGVPGDTTANMLARANPDVFAYKPDLLFILGGTNDLGQGISQSITISHIRSLIIGSRSRGVRVFLILVPPNSTSGSQAAIDSLNAAITHLGNIYTLVVIDIHTPLSGSNGLYQARYTSDGLHFSALGAQVVANTIYTRIHRLGY
jgi:lysophospholipase L1-like esterase